MKLSFFERRSANADLFVFEVNLGYRKTFVESEQIQALEYDDFIETLTVYFLNGAVYDYIGVSPEIADEFLVAPKKSWYLRNRIIPNYEHMIKVKAQSKRVKNED